MLFQQSSQHAELSMPRPAFDRSEVAERILGPYRNQRVLVVGIGGGGDVVSTLPTCFDLERVGAYPIPAGLTWKRVVHDTYGRPRPIDQFDHVTQINDLIGEANPHTRTRDGGTQIEANISRALGGIPVGMIDISPGVARLREALEHYRQLRSIDVILGVDAGGDVLCFGHEPTLESPICDQTVLAAISTMPGALLGVFGFGADGEMSLDAFRERFRTLNEIGAYRALLPVATEDISRMQAALLEAPTEASRLPMQVAQIISAERLLEVGALMNGGAPVLEQAIGSCREIPMRDGLRTARLSDLSATTMFFEPHKVFRSSRFNELIREDHSIDQVHEVLTQAGITTEFTERERLKAGMPPDSAS